MDEKQLKALYEAMGDKLDLGSFDVFKGQLSDDKFRKAFYDQASSDIDLGDFDSFSSSFKKKEPTTPSEPSFPQEQISGTAIATQPEPVFPKEDVTKRYNDRVRGGAEYLDSYLKDKKSKQTDANVSSDYDEFFSTAKKLNDTDPAGRLDYVYDFLKRNSDIDNNAKTRDAFINSQFAGVYYSKSTYLQKEYESSSLNKELTPRQYAGYKSLTYGQKDYAESLLKTASDKNASEQDRENAKIKLDNYGIDVDKDAASSMFVKNTNPDMSSDLFQSADRDYLLNNEKIRDLEYKNPYSLTSISGIVERATRRGMAMGNTADILTATSKESGIDVDKLAELQRSQREARASKAYEQFSDNPTWDNFKKNPVGILTELSLESLVALYSHGSSRMAAGAATGALIGTPIAGIGAAVGASSGAIAGLGMSSLNLEFSSTMLDQISSAGYDTSNPDDLKKAFSDEKLMSDLKSTAYKKGIPVAIFDMISAGVAGKMLAGAKTVGGKILAGVAETGAQAVAGAGGEATGQKLAYGKITSPSAILMEAIGEIGPGVVEIAYGNIVENAKRGNTQSNSDLVNAASNKKQAFDNIDINESSGILTKQEADKAKNDINKAVEIVNKMPNDLSNEAKADIMPLIDQRQKLNQQIETVDESLKAPLQSQVKELDTRIQDIYNQDKQGTYATTKITGIVQEGVPEGGIVQPTRAEAQGQEAPSETNVGNRPISGERQVTAQDVEVSSNSEGFAQQMTAAQESLGVAGLSVSPYSQEEYDAEAKKGGKFFRADNNNILGLLKSTGEMVSLVKNAASKAKGAAQAVINSMKEKGGLFMDNYDIYLTPLYEKAGYKVIARVPFNEQYAPEGWDAEGSTLKGKPDVVFMVRNDIAPAIEQKFDSYEQAAEYTKSIVDKAVTEGKVKTPTEIGGISRTIETILPNVQKSLAASGVDVQIVDNEEDAVKIAGEAARGNQGVFINKKGKIVIDQSKLANAIESGVVVWHEASHPVMNIIRNTNKPLYDKISAGLRAAAEKNQDVEDALNWATEQYSDQGEGTVADESIVETIGRIGAGVIDPNSIETGVKQALIDFINSIAKALGFDQILDDTDVAAFKRVATQVADALRAGRGIEEIVGAENVFEYGAPFNEQVQARIPDKYGAKIKAKESYSLSFVKPSDLIDIRSLIDDIANTGKKVWFWTADQLGRGQYYDKVINGEHFLDAGPSFALDPKNRDRGVIWATGKGESWINKNIQNSDYIFIISGSPLKSKMFNKRVAEITINRIKATADFNKFKSDVLGVSKIKDLNNLLNDFNSFDELISSPRRKDFLSIIDEQKSKKSTPLKAMLEKYNAFVDYNELRDGFYKDNGFDLNDIMLVLKPEKFGGKSEHSTYENDIIGSVVGVPDRIVNAFNIMTDEVKSKYERELTRTEQAQAVAPYGAGIRGVQASKGGRAELSKSFKLASFVMRKKQEGASTAEIVSGIASVTGMSPEDIKPLVDNPEQWLMDQNPGMSDVQKKNLVERAKIQNIYRSRQFGKPLDTAFAGLEVPKEFVDDYLNKNKSKDKNLAESVKDFKSKWLDPARGLPDWVLAEKDFASGAKNIEIARAMKTIEALKAEAKKIGFEDWDSFSKAIVAVNEVKRYIPDVTTPAPFDAARAAEGRMFTTPDEQLPSLIPNEIKSLPESIIPFVYQMRSQIDGLTKDLIGSGYVTLEQAVTLESNIGAYVNRAYRMYNEKGWKPAKEQISDAVKFLADQYIKEIATDNAGIITFEQVRDQAVEKAQKDVQSIIDKKRNPYFNASVEARNTGILKERKDIPEPIRKLMGEYTDPGTVFIMTVAKQAALKASSQYLSKMREFGLGELFFEKDDPKRPAEFSVQIAAQGTESKSPLNGLYTTPEIADILESQDPTYNDITNLWMKMVGAVRWGKTVGSVVTQFKNFESNLGFAVMNGLLFSGKSGQAFKGSVDYVKGQYTKSEMDAITEKAIKLNLVGQSVGARELSSMLGSGNIHDIALDIAVNPDNRWGKKIAKRFNVFGAANKLYRMGDDFWKVYAYMNEREMVARGRYNGKAYSELTEQEQEKVDIESSERVKNTWPTYDRVVEAAKKVSKSLPILGNFPSFQAESIRTLVNTIKMAREDMKDPEMRAHGVRRMIGITTYVMARTAITYALAQSAGMAASGLFGKLMGDDDEERKKHAMKHALPPYAITSDILALQSKSDPHKYTVYSLSSMDPYGLIPNSLNALTDGREGIFGKRMEPGVSAALVEAFSSFLEPEMTFDAIWSITNNTNSKTGRAIVNDTDTDVQAFGKVMSYIWDQLEPSTISLAKRGAERGWAPELASFAGARPIDVDLHKAFGFVLADMGKQMETVNSDYNKIKYNDKYSEEQKAAAEADAENRKAFLISKVNTLYREFIELGANPKELDEIIKNKSSVKTTGFDKTTKKYIKIGVVNPEKLFK